eukprot:3649326-Pyramimonas_sp.AAC.1
MDVAECWRAPSTFQLIASDSGCAQTGPRRVVLAGLRSPPRIVRGGVKTSDAGCTQTDPPQVVLAGLRSPPEYGRFVRRRRAERFLTTRRSFNLESITAPIVQGRIPSGRAASPYSSVPPRLEIRRCKTIAASHNSKTGAPRPHLFEHPKWVPKEWVQCPTADVVPNQQRP